MNTTGQTKGKFENTALIVVDIQNDFVNGSLATDVDSEYTESTAQWIKENKDNYSLVLTTQDWHVADDTVHIEQWGEHCMSNTNGAQIHEKIVEALGEGTVPFRKGHEDHGYSGFEGVMPGAQVDSPHPEETIAGFLRSRVVNTVHIIGIATEHCVRATAIDAAKNGLKTIVFSDLVNPVDLEAGKNALKFDMPDNGVKVITSEEALTDLVAQEEV